MKCGCCDKEMTLVKTVVYPADMSTLTDFPEKMTAMKIEVYQCNDCKVQSSRQEDKTYFPAITIVKE